MITQKYNLNMIPDTVPVSVGVSQYDKTSRTIIFSIYNGDVLFSIPSGSTAFVRGTKPDKTGFEYPCTISGSDISFDIEEQMTVLAGRFPVELRIINSGEILGTANFMLNVEASPLSDDTIISDTDMPLIQEASAAADRAEAAASQAEGLLSTVVKKVNNVSPDSSGNVELDFGTVKSVNNVSPDTNGNVTLDYGTVKTINNVSPDSSGNVNVLAVPSGGLTNQVLAKASATFGDTAWKYMSFKLWENEAETSDFSSKEISLSNINDYGCIIVVYRMAKHSGYENYTSVVIPSHIGAAYRTSMFIGSGRETYRTATRRTTGVFFGVASLNDTPDNAYMIPVAIYGVA